MHPRPVQQLLVCDVKDEEVNEVFLSNETQFSVVDLSHLLASQQEEVASLLDSELFGEAPGFTDLVQRDICLKMDAPAWHKSYRIPGARAEERDQLYVGT